MNPFKTNRRQALQTLGAAAAGTTLLSPTVFAQNSGEIVLGQSAMLTGPLGPGFLPVVKGQEVAIQEFNAKGGAKGRPVRLITLDDAYDTKKAVENTTKLIDQENVVGLFGYASTANVMAVLPMLQEKKVPLIGVYGGSPALRQKQHPYFFTTMASYQDEVVELVKNLISTQRSQFAVIYQNHAFGQQMVPVVEAIAKQMGATVVAKHPLEMNGSDAIPAAQAIGAGKPQAALLLAFGPSTVAAIKAVRNHVGVPVYALSIANDARLIAALGEDGRGMAYTQVVPYPWRQTTALTRDFASQAAKSKVPVDYSTFYGYVSTRVMLEGVKRAANAAGGKPVTSAALTRGMEAIGKYDMGGLQLAYGPNNHHGVAFTETVIVGPNGRYIR